MKVPLFLLVLAFLVKANSSQDLTENRDPVMDYEYDMEPTASNFDDQLRQLLKDKKPINVKRVKEKLKDDGKPTEELVYTGQLSPNMNFTYKKRTKRIHKKKNLKEVKLLGEISNREESQAQSLKNNGSEHIQTTALKPTEEPCRNEADSGELQTKDVASTIGDNGADKDIDDLFNIIAPGEKKEPKKVNHYVNNLLQLLRSERPSKHKIYAIFEKFKKDKVKLPSTVISLIKVLLQNLVNSSEDGEWKIMLDMANELELSQVINYNEQNEVPDKWVFSVETTPSPNESDDPNKKYDKLDLNVEIDAVTKYEFPSPNQNNEIAREYILAVLHLLQSTETDINKVYDVLVLLKQVAEIPSNLLSLLVSAVKKRLAEVDWSEDVERNILHLLEELRTSPDLNMNNNLSENNDYNSNKINDEWGLNVDIDAVTQFKFPSQSANNEIVREYILAILRLLQSTEPDTSKVYDVLVLLKQVAEIPSNLLSLLVSAVKKRLAEVDLSEDVIRNILHLLEELGTSPDLNKNNNLSENNDYNSNKINDEWGLNVDIDAVTQFKFPSQSANNEIVREYILAILRLLQSPEPDKMKMYDVLVLLQLETGIPLNLISLLHRAVKKRVGEGNVSDDLWKKILTIVDEQEKSIWINSKEELYSNLPGFLGFLHTIFTNNELPSDEGSSSDIILLFLKNLYLELHSASPDRKKVELIVTKLRKYNIQITSDLNLLQNDKKKEHDGMVPYLLNQGQKLKVGRSKQKRC